MRRSKYQLNLASIYCWIFSVLAVLPSSALAQSDTEAGLTDIIVHAYSHHPQLKSLRAQLHGTKEVITEARAQYLPQIVLDGNISASDRSALLQNGSSFDQNTTPKSLSLRLNQTLYNGGRRALSQRSAKLSVEASEARYETIAAGIAADIIQDYMSLLTAVEERKVLTKSVETLKELEASVLARRKVGDSTITEVSQAKSRLAGAQARLATARSSQQLAESRLFSKTGFHVKAPHLPAKAKQTISAPLEDIKIIANDFSPALKASRINEMAANVVARSETRKHLPTISLVANATTVRDSSPTIDRDEDLNVGLRVTMPIFTAGVGRARTRRALANFNAARYDYVNTVRESDLRITQLWSQIQNSVYVLEAQKASVEASEEALKGVTRAKDAGLTDTQDILDAEQNKLEAELAMMRAQYQQYTSRLLLHLFMGNLDVYEFE